MWQYAIVEHEFTFNGEKNIWYEVHEYYKGGLFGKKGSITQEGIIPQGDTPEGLLKNLKWMMNDCKHMIKNNKILKAKKFDVIHPKQNIMKCSGSYNKETGKFNPTIKKRNKK